VITAGAEKTAPVFIFSLKYARSYAMIHKLRKLIVKGEYLK